MNSPVNLDFLSSRVSAARRSRSAATVRGHHHHRLRAADQRAKCIFRAHLRGFIDDQDVEAVLPGSRYCATDIGLIMMQGL